MIKGITKRVVVVASPDPRIFEQAIFIVREDYAGQAGVCEEDVLRQARQAANHYIRNGGGHARKRLSHVPAPFFAAAGAAATGIAWLAMQLVR
jgi:hypothetical protein